MTDAVKGRYRRPDTAGSRLTMAGRGSQTGSQLPRPEQAEVETAGSEMDLSRLWRGTSGVTPM